MIFVCSLAYICTVSVNARNLWKLETKHDADFIVKAQLGLCPTKILKFLLLKNKKDDDKELKYTRQYHLINQKSKSKRNGGTKAFEDGLGASILK